MKIISGAGRSVNVKSHWCVCVGTGVLAVAVLAGCGRRQEDMPESALAMVGEVPITEAHFAFEVQRRRETGRPIGEPSDIIADMVEREAMLQRARQSEALADPVVQRELENQVLVKWLDQELHQRRDAVRVTDEDLIAYYDAHQDAFLLPELLRVAILYRRVTPSDPEETQASLVDALSAARASFLADPVGATRDGRLQGFGLIAAEHSEHTVSRYRGGDLGWLDAEQAMHRLPADVLAVVRSLEVGDVSEVMTTAEGVYVVMKTDFRAARVQPFEEVASGLRRRVIRERQDAIETEFRRQLLEQANVTMQTDRIASLRIPQEDPAAARTGAREASGSVVFEGEQF